MALRAAARGVTLASMVGLVTVVTFGGCSIGGGTGSIKGVLQATDCWSGPFDLQPSFYAANPYNNALQIRIQQSRDLQDFSDGLSILVDDVTTIRGTGVNDRLGQALAVSLPAGVTPPGVPLQANADPAPVHMNLYLLWSCKPQDPALYAMSEVSLGTTTDCSEFQPIDCSSTSSGTTATADGGIVGTATSADGGVTTNNIGTSSITFQHLFSGDPDEANAAERLTEASFDVYLADPHDVCPGGLGPPPPCRGHLKGNFRFYFERGQPAQPFP